MKIGSEICPGLSFWEGVGGGGLILAREVVLFSEFYSSLSNEMVQGRNHCVCCW